MEASDIWYLADKQGQIGPLSLPELKEKLAATSDAGDVLVWRSGFADWKKAQDVPTDRRQRRKPGISRRLSSIP
jgi:hypothetical protein